ncbi:MAG: signal transduction histidine kinase [Segetibacter sp.]|nr:signal transduction histidine kinase [Segetibacter sp.]
MNTRKFIALIILTGLAISLSAQPYYFRHYKVENGLSNNMVTAVLQDKKGFVWFGTKDGLNRFDGYNFKVFRNEQNNPKSIGANFIHCIYESADSNIWVGTYKGLYRYDELTESFDLVIAYHGSYTRDIKMDTKGNLWVITGPTLNRYNIKSGRLDKFPPDQYFNVTSLCVTNDGTVWVATDDGYLYKHNDANGRFTAYSAFSHSSATTSKSIQKLFATGTNEILIGTKNHGIKSFNTNNYTYKDLLTHNDDKTELYVRDFLIYSKDEIWAATETGIIIYNVKAASFTRLQKQFTNPYTLSDNAIRAICKDKEGGVWVATYFGGVNYYSRQFSFFNKYFPTYSQNSLRGNAVKDMCQDYSGNIWIGTEDGGLNKFITATGTFKNFKPNGTKTSICYTNVQGLMAVDNELWIGMYEHGIDVMDINIGKVIRHYGAGAGKDAFKSNSIVSFCKTRIGDILVGTYLGLYRYHPTTNTFTIVKGIPTDANIQCILEDDEGLLWVGTVGNGLFVINEQNEELHAYNNYIRNKDILLQTNRINGIFEDSDQNIWLATEGLGLYRYNKHQNTLQKYTAEDGLPSNLVFKVLEDGKKNLWFSTSKGLVFMDRAKQDFTIYRSTNGLLTDQFNYNSGFKDREGNMYFGSVGGLIWFKPERFTKINYTPSVIITDFRLQNMPRGSAPFNTKKSILYTDKVILNYYESSFSIDFTALNFTDPENTQFAYKLEGIDENYTILKTNRKVYFTNLSPGTYTFKVKAVNSSGVWNADERKLVIEILPPFWASSAAYLVYIITCLIIGFGLLHLYRKRLEDKNQKKMQHLAYEKEKEVYQAKIDFFTNVAHEIRTPLTLIKGPLESLIEKVSNVPEIRNSLKMMERNTNRLVDLTNQLLDFRKTETKGFSLNFSKTDITELLKEIYHTFKPAAEEKSIDFEISYPANSIAAFVDSEALRKILSNLLSNAIKYAETVTSVYLLPVHESHHSFIIEVSNDGFVIPQEMNEKIFEAFYRLPQTQAQNGSGIGLSISRSLAELHNGTIHFKAIENNLNVFVLTMPLNQLKETGSF